MDAITLLRDDHQRVETLFKKFEDTGERAVKTRRNLVDKIVEELSVHAAIEEQLFYPWVRKHVPDIESDVLEALEEHHVAKIVLAELVDLPADHERFEAKVTVMIENVRHHVKEEQDEMFPSVRDAAKKSDLEELGEQMRTAKKVAPKRPHPGAPDEPPANIAVGLASGAVDRVADAARKGAKAATKAVTG